MVGPAKLSSFFPNMKRCEGSLGLLKPYSGRLGWLFFLIGIGALAEALGLLLLSVLISLLVNSENAGGRTALFAVMREYSLASPRIFLISLGVIYLAKSLLGLYTNYLSYSVALRMVRDWQRRFIQGFLCVPWGQLNKQQGAMVQLIMDEPGTAGFGMSAAGVLAQNVLSALAVYATLFYVSPVVTLGITVVAVAAMAAISILSVYSRRIGMQRSQVYTDGYAYLAEMLSALKLLRLFHLEAEAEGRAMSRLDKMREATLKSNVIASSPRLIIEIVFLCGLVAMMVLVAPRIGEEAILPALGLAVAAAVRLLPSFSASAGTWVQMQHAWPAMEKISDELHKLEQHTKDTQANSGWELVSFRDRIDVRDVSFSYPCREQALAGVDIAIPHGAFIAVVGPSGAGKSTLVDLLCGFYTPDKGKILVDGVDLCQISMSGWRRQLGVVLQDGFLLSGTIRENLCLLRPKCPEHRLREIAALVGADRFIKELPEGYETWIGERGITLSGGQRQRLALARVLIADPAILILDEATSALDVESEQAIKEGLDRLRGSVTMIVIAHRLSTVRQADRIYVLDGGKVVESGLHDELIRRGGVYATMSRTAEQGTIRG